MDMLSPDALKEPGQGKYGTPEAFSAKLHDGEPWFVFRAQDQLAPAIVRAYARLLEDVGLMEAAAQVTVFAGRMKAWQEQNPNKVKLPD